MDKKSFRKTDFSTERVNETTFENRKKLREKKNMKQIKLIAKNE